VSTAQSRGCGFDGRRALLEAVFVDGVEPMCALWVWLRHIAQQCAAENALTVLMRTSGADEAARRRVLTCVDDRR
jgi:hypothetical protein